MLNRVDLVEGYSARVPSMLIHTHRIRTALKRGRMGSHRRTKQLRKDVLSSVI